MIPRLLSVLVLAAVCAVVLAPAAEAATCPKTSLIEIQSEVMCVICGVPLVNAGGPQSEDQRDFIRERADRCESKEEIKAALVEEYGPPVLAVPQKSGFDLTAWVVPIIALVLALIAIVAGAVSWSKARGPAAEGAGEAAADDQLNSDFERYDL